MGREKEIMFYGKRYNNHSLPIKPATGDGLRSVDTHPTRLRDDANRKSMASFTCEKTVSRWNPRPAHRATDLENLPLTIDRGPGTVGGL